MFKLSEDCSYSMPAHFGGTEGVAGPWTYAEVTSILVSYETDRDQLSRYVPEGFEVTQPVLLVLYQMCRGVEWMAGGHYNLIAVNVPVAYVHGQERIEGQFALVVWENKACPILGGREQTGIPKIFANIEDHRQFGDKRFTNASYEGLAFLGVDFEIKRTMSPGELKSMHTQVGKLNWFGWRYIPNIGRPGSALSHATLYPLENVLTAGWSGEGEVHWQAPTWQQHPAQAHIIRALSELPIKGYRDCAMTLGSQVLRTDGARELH
ncbi:MAG: acetoacetate decarboxylase [Betaproteobacteria bacterium]|nr:MAG: acetoacetate decarboxylase [Betaproteobacteria bacterium]